MKGEYFIKELVDEVFEMIDMLSLCDNYDVSKFLYALRHNLSQLLYFYGDLAKDKDPDDTYYRIPKKPRVNQLAYMNIGRGFPKELMDGHWCYIVKDMGVKAVVVPCTSIKKDSNINPLFEMDILVLDNGVLKMSRLQLSDMRTVDYQRIDIRKNFYTVLTPRKRILKFIQKNLFD